MRKILIVEIDITSATESWVIAIQKAELETRHEVEKHIILRQRPGGAITNIPPREEDSFVVAIKEENRW